MDTGPWSKSTKLT